MLLERYSLLGKSALVALVLACSANTAWAAPEDDFKEGARHNARGDVVAAMPLFRSAADAGHAGAQAALGELLHQADLAQEALVYFRKSADQGNSDGQYGLAAMLAMGDGTAQDLPQARKYFIAAAEQGHPASIETMASSYLTGGLGLAESERKGPDALRWIRLSADKGYRPAMEALANAYRKGDYGLSVDTKVADAWDEKIRKISGAQSRRRSAKKPISLEKQ
jgi:uncharacterized protein